MSSFLTVVFADLSGSTPLYETLGNERATETVMRLTQWMGDVMRAHGGRVVKVLGDGVLGVFGSAAQGVCAATELQRSHQIHLHRWPAVARMEMHAGVATGDVLEVDGDAYGDAVNVASRLCERAGPGEIWTTDVTAVDAGVVPQVQFRKLGVFELRGKSEPQAIFQAEWRDDESPDLLTMQASLHSAIAPLDSMFGTIQLSWQGESLCYSSADVPVHVGRSSAAQLCISDPRVSRMHARIDWHNGSFSLTDVSSFGTWVHYDGSDAAVALRRDSCRLYGSGKIALGMPFEAGAPLLDFRVAGNNMRLG
jgi:adenylate cyclase